MNIEKVVQNLKKNGFNVIVADDKTAALEEAKKLIPEGASVGVGGSVTLDQIGLRAYLADTEHTVFDHSEAGIDKEERKRRRQAQLSCDVFFCSANAVTGEGELVNMDGVGNRLAALCYGPKRVVVVAGENKLVEGRDAAVERIRKTAAPLNTKRLDFPNPCAETGECMDCAGEMRICSQLLFTGFQSFTRGRITVILVRENAT